MIEDNYNLKLKVRLLIIVILVMTVSFISIFVYRSSGFRLTGTDPSARAVATTSPFFKISFNRPLASSVSVRFYPQNFPSSYVIKGSSVTVSFNKALQEGATYSIRLTNIKDVAGDKLTDKTISFQAQYINSSDLSSEQQQALRNKQARYDTIQGDGLVKLLPFTGGGNEFQVSYTINYSGRQPNLIIVITASTPQGQSDALNWIRQVGFDPSKYTITFATNQGNDK